MSDKEKLVELLKSFGLKQGEANQGNPWSSMEAHTFEVTDTEVNLGAGKGYAGFYASFVFTDKGKFVHHGVWE